MKRSIETSQWMEDGMRIVMTVTALALLAACNRSPTIEATNASRAEVANKIAAAGGAESFVRPGKWATTVSIDEMAVPGMPPEAAARIKGMNAKGRAFETCLTPEQAKKPTAEMFNGNSDRCRYDHFNMGAGKIDMVMRCTGAGAGKSASQVMTMTGTYSPDSYHMAMDSKTETGTGGSGPMTMKMHLDANRLGECGAPKKAAG